MFLLFLCGAWSVNLLQFAFAVAALSLCFRHGRKKSKKSNYFAVFIN